MRFTVCCSPLAGDHDWYTVSTVLMLILTLYKLRHFVLASYFIALFLLLCVIQVPSEEEETESEKSLQKFVEELPVLELVGEVKHILPDQ